MVYECIFDGVHVDWNKDDDISCTAVLIRGWNFDESIRTVMAVGIRECLVSLDDVMGGGEELALAVETHLTELGIQEVDHGWMIAELIKYIKEFVIPHPLFFTLTMDIVEATPVVTFADVYEALHLYSDIVKMKKFQLCGAEQDENLSCVICTDEGGKEGHGFALMPCKHVFHVTCVARWFRINPLCPICRRYSKPE